MSKTILRKELQQMSHEQLEDLLLELYDARKEVKEYFKFFLNPDVNKLTEKYKNALAKEIYRNKRGHTKARISQIKKLVKEFQSFHPGFDKEIELLEWVVMQSVGADMLYGYTETLNNGIAYFLETLLSLADRNMMADKIINRITNILHDPHIHQPRSLRTKLKDTLANFVPAIKPA